MQRGGFPAKTLILALFVVGTVYLLYLYNTTLGHLRDAELSAERYRREEETKVAQLQVARELTASLKDKQISLEGKIMEVMRSKDELQERFDKEKQEFINRLNSLNQQHKMLKSQYDEHEVEQMRLEQEARRVKEEFQQVEAQRNQEYQQLKQQKDLEISTLRDQLADAQRQNEQLQTQITSLRTQLQNGESQIEYDQALLRNKDSEIASLQQQLLNKNAELQQHQELQRQQQQYAGGMQNANNFQQQQPQQGLQYDPNAQPQQQQQHQFGQQQFVQQQQQQQQRAGFGQQGNVANMNVANEGDNNQAGQQDQAGLHGGLAQGVFNDAQKQFEQQEQQRQQQQQRVEEINAQHQVLPPHNNDINAGAGNADAPVNAQVDGQHGGHAVEVNNEDHQVRPPNVHGQEEEEEEDEDDARQLHRQPGGPGDREEEEEEDDQHEDPLELKQVERPQMKDEVQDRGVEQQQPPVQRMQQGGRNEAEEEEEEQEEEEEEEDQDEYDDKEDERQRQPNNVEINREADFH